VAVSPNGFVAVGSWAYWSTPAVGVGLQRGRIDTRSYYTPTVMKGGLAWYGDTGVRVSAEARAPGNARGADVFDVDEQ